MRINHDVPVPPLSYGPRVAGEPLWRARRTHTPVAAERAAVLRDAGGGSAGPGALSMGQGADAGSGRVPSRTSAGVSTRPFSVTRAWTASGRAWSETGRYSRSWFSPRIATLVAPHQAMMREAVGQRGEFQ